MSRRRVMNLSEEEYIDLSYMDIHGNITDKQTTANCYVINTPGYYKFPCIYGNAISNGVFNSIAYTNNGSAYADDFINYKSIQISNPFIWEDSGIIASALLSIADTDNIFTDIKVKNDNLLGSYVMFKVESVPETGANGIISIKDSSNVIMWSWHIWVWPDDLTPVNITNIDNVEYNILPVNLGSKWVTNSSNPTLITNWYYLWGRPTPFPASSDTRDNEFCTTYGKLNITYSTYILSYGDFIQKPTTLYRDYLQYGANRWNLAQKLMNTDVEVVKTVYDPCPPGFKMPNSNVFTYLVDSGYYNPVSNGNIIGIYVSRYNGLDPDLYFPCLGSIISPPGEIVDKGIYSHIWTSLWGAKYGSAPDSARAGAMTLYHIGYSSSILGLETESGLSVRPVLEISNIN